MNATITLKNDHGYFEVDAEVLNKVVFKYGDYYLPHVRKWAADCCGHSVQPDGTTAFDDCSRIECLIMWVESGNYVL
jgi:hypothetical protein